MKNELKLFGWLYCRMARVGLKNGWLMGFIAVCIAVAPDTFWWRAPLLYLAVTLVATVITRVAPEDSESDNWEESIATKKEEINKNPPVTTGDVTVPDSKEEEESKDEESV